MTDLVMRYRERADQARSLGAATPVTQLDDTDLDRFVRQRRRGQIQPPGRKLSPNVSNRTIAADIKWLQTALTWATRKKMGRGSMRLLDTNPLRTYSPPASTTQKRPVADHERFEALMAVGPFDRQGLWQRTGRCAFPATAVTRNSRLPYQNYERMWHQMWHKLKSSDRPARFVSAGQME